MSSVTKDITDTANWLEENRFGSGATALRAWLLSLGGAGNVSIPRVLSVMDLHRQKWALTCLRVALDDSFAGKDQLFDLIETLHAEPGATDNQYLVFPK